MLRSEEQRERSPTAFGYVMAVSEDGTMRPEWVSESYSLLTGYSFDDLGSKAMVDRMVPAEDHPIIEDALATLMRGEDWAGDHRLITSSGEVKWLRFFTHPERDESGRVVRFEGSGHDVTDLRQREIERRGTDEALKMLDEAVWPIIWTTDRDGIITSSTGTGLRLYGFEPGDNVGVPFREVAGSDDPDYPPNAATRKALNGERSAYEMEWRGHLFRTIIEPLKDENGEVIGTAGVTIAKDVVARNLESTLARGVLEQMEDASLNGTGVREVIRAGDLTVDPVAFAAWKGSERLHLSPTEFRLLRELASRPNEAISREELLRDVWNHQFMGDSRLVDMAINRLRAKVEDDPHEPTFILTVRDIGYRFEDKPPSSG